MPELKSKIEARVSYPPRALISVMKKLLPIIMTISLLAPTLSTARSKIGAELADVVGFSFSLPFSDDAFGEFNLGWRNLNKEKSLIHSAYYLLNDRGDLVKSGSEKIDIYYGVGYKLVSDEEEIENDTIDNEENKKEFKHKLYLRGQVGLRYHNSLFELFFSMLP